MDQFHKKYPTEESFAAAHPEDYNALHEYKNGGMIKRADGSYSQRGLWDNIRANRGSGKKPTKQMLEQEAKIKAQHEEGGYITDDLSLDKNNYSTKPPKNSKKIKLNTEVIRPNSDNLNSYTSVKNSPYGGSNISANLISWLDPTGTTNYPDLIKTIENKDWNNLPIEILGSLPMVGKFGQGIKSLKTTKNVPIGRVLPILDDMHDEMDSTSNEYGGGGYVVKRSSERKGKTHVVIGPDGTKKYFGDSNLGQHPNDPERKKAFYARHKHNLANNPYFRAFARKTWAEGGEIDDEFDQYADGGKTGMMKARMALDAHFGNPAAKRMVSANPKTGMTPEGIGTHYMTSMGNYAIPLLQDFGDANLRLVDGMTPSKEDMRFESPEDAEYFAQHYKEIAPMMKNFKEYKYGGIHIKPENKGKFTAWAKSHGMGVQEAASHVMANKGKYSSTIVKRANFAKNAAKFKHAEGGEVEPNNTFGLTGNYSRNPNPKAVESNYKLAADYQRKLGNFNAGLNANLGFNHTLPLNTDGFNGAPMIRPDANVGLNLNYDRNNSNFSGNFNYNPMNQGINAEVSYKKKFAVGGMVQYPDGGSTGLLQSYYDSQGGPGFKGGVFGGGYLKGDVNRLGYNASAGLNLNPVMLGVGYGNMMGKDMPFLEGQITPSLGSFGSRRGPQGNVYGVAAGKYYADPNQMAALEKNLMDPNASAVMGRAGLGVNLKPSYRSKFGFSGEGGYDMVNDQPYFNAGVRYNIGDGGNTNGCGRGPKHKSYGRLDFAEGGLMKYDMGGPTLKDIEAAKVTTPATTTPKTGLTTYQGGMQKTPTGQSNAFSNNQFNLTDKLVTDYAKQHNLPTDNNANFQSAQLKMLQGTPQGQALLDKMNSTFGATKAGKYDDGILGARTQYLIQNDNIANPSKPNGYGQTWTKSIDANGNTVLTGRDGTVKVLPKKADSSAVASTLANDMLTRRVPLATKAMGGTIGRSLKKYGDAGTVTTAGDATNPQTTSNGMFEVVGKGKGWKNPNLASAGIGAGAQIAELALSKVPNNEYTDDEGNVVGSSTNTWAGIGKGAAQGAATGAALGPYGALAGAVIGGAMGYFNSAEEEEAAKKAQVESNNRISLKRIRGKANESAGLTQTMGTQLYPYGGSINTDQEGANAELELNEQFMLPGGEVGQVNGPSHDEGGIEVALPEGTKVFSDRLKLNGKTYAEHAKKINNKIRSLDRKPDSVAKANTEMLFNQQLNNLFNTQEEYKSQRDANFAQQFAQGGTIGSWEIIED